MAKRWMFNALPAAAMGAAMATAGCLGAPGTGAGEQVNTEPAAPLPAAAPPTGRALLGPFTHANLTVFLIADGSVRDAREFITLDEGLAAGTVQVHERGATQGRDDSTVNTLEISNTSGKWLYIEAGEVVKGGKQDRTLGRDAILAPGATNQPLAAFCVERGRWSAGGATNPRGGGCPTPTTSTYSYTPTTYFPTYYPTTPTGPTGPTAPSGSPPTGPSAPTAASAPTAPSSPTAPSGSHATPWPTPAAGTAPSSGGPSGPAAPGMQFKAARAALAPSMKMAILKEKNQGKVWDGVAQQRSAWGAQSSSSGTWMDVARSKKVEDRTAPYLKALQPMPQGRAAVVGVVFVRDGTIVAADEYCAPQLFSRLYPKLLAAHAREAALSKAKFDGTLPDRDRVEAFLAEADRGASKQESTVEGQSLRTCENDRTITFEAGEGGSLMHRSILAKTECETGK